MPCQCVGVKRLVHLYPPPPPPPSLPPPPPPHPLPFLNADTRTFTCLVTFPAHLISRTHCPILLVASCARPTLRTRDQLLSPQNAFQNFLSLELEDRIADCLSPSPRSLRGSPFTHHCIISYSASFPSFYASSPFLRLSNCFFFVFHVPSLLMAVLADKLV